MGKDGKRWRKRRQSAVDRAGLMLKISKSGDGSMTVNDAMKIAGFNTVDRTDKTYQRQVYRQRDGYLTAGAGRTNLMQSMEAVAASAPAAANLVAVVPIDKKKLSTVNGKKSRQTSKQAHIERQAAAQKKKLRDLLFTRACAQWKVETVRKAEATEEGLRYKTKSPEDICLDINATSEAKDHGIRVVARSVRTYVKEGRAGQPMAKPGGYGRLSVEYYEALYVLLSQQDGTKTSNRRPQLINKVNACVNKREGAGSRRNRKLFDRIQRDLADELNVGKPDRVEQRRNKWSTFSNLNLWFTSVKEFLIDKGFAKAADPLTVEQDGELVWSMDDQGKRIANIDESGLSTDNTEQKGHGGRPSSGFYDSRISDAPTFGAHKSSYHATLVAGTFASGEKFAEHFQIPTDAKEKDNEGFGIEFVEDMLLTRGTYLFNGEPQAFSPTYGVNEKGGMNKDDFGQYIMTNFVRLVAADAADVPGKRVILLVDGGPGRTNEEMLHELRMRGIYLFPSGPPNTTHILQIMDMLFGAFKTTYFDNLAKLWEYRQNNHTIASTITRHDIGVLAYGSQHSLKRQQDPSFPLLRNAIEEAFSVEKTKHCWADKLGFYPCFTRAALTSKQIRHEMVVTDDGVADVEEDPESAYLQHLADLNQLSCDVLDAAGYNGSLLRWTVTAFKTSLRKEAVTQPRTKERQEAIESSKAGSGKFFQRTGGAAINDDDIFIAHERKALKEELSKLESSKKDRDEAIARQEAAFEVLAEVDNDKPVSRYTVRELKILCAWKHGKPCPSKWNKPEFLAAWNVELKDKFMKPAEQWTDTEEAEVVALRQKIEGDIALGETNYGRKLEEERKKARSVLLAMPRLDRLALLDDLGSACEAVDRAEDDDTSRTEDPTETSEV